MFEKKVNSAHMYIVRFNRLDGCAAEEYHYRDEEAARQHFEDAEDESDVYTTVELLEYDPVNDNGKLLDIAFYDGDEDEEDDSCSGSDINEDMAAIKEVLANSYECNEHGAVVCLSDEQCRRLVYGGDEREIVENLACAVAAYAHDDADMDIFDFLRDFNDAVLEAYRLESKRSSRE